MILKIFAIYDAKAEAYSAPIFLHTTGLAIRSFIDAASDQSTNFCKYPADYTLFEIGTFDDSTGMIVQNKVHQSLGTALEHQIKKPVPMGGFAPPFGNAPGPHDPVGIRKEA